MRSHHKYLLILAFLAYGFASCQKEPDNIPDVPDEPQQEYEEFQLSSYSVAFEAQSEAVVLELNTKYEWSVDVQRGASFRGPGNH